jgi:hypothetical protein
MTKKGQGIIGQHRLAVMTTYSQAIAFTVDMIVTNRFILLVGCF